ncbi:MAG TPA: DUF5060 domain-containing protein [Sedimentisphaerales bacterium]|nr:DUF5060 domain-containing protein [Sedimentisphaerales bacterium]
MKSRRLVLLTFVFLVPTYGCALRSGGAAVVSGELKQWHNVVLTFDGPMLSERSQTNPFLDCRLNVTFVQGEKTYVVPGYFAADGEAGQTGAKIGNKWRAHFLPSEPGVWIYTASFRYGADVAIDPCSTAGKPAYFDGATGAFTVEPTDKTGRDFRARGLLKYVGQRYLQFAGTKSYFIKGGADSPENFLAYADFDDTYDTEELTREGEAAGGKFIHTYEPHVEDWRPGDPTWHDGKGKGIIGALNYLASKGMNSVYFLTYNLDGGDGKDVWMWTDPVERYRFDCSKLDQWEIVFSHMDKLGLMLHVVTQETENDQALDGGDLGIQRRLYYRELIARFAHHPALVWNLGEENTNTTEQRKAFAKYIHDLDPYDHPVVCHTYPGQYNQVYEPLLGYEWFEGASLQTNDTHDQTLKWVTLSAQAGRQWFVCLDEIGPAHTGVKPDKDDFWHDEVRIQHLWGNLMAGGAGVEWYFGYSYSHNDLNCESWHSRDHMWDLTRYALEFFHTRLPFASMAPRDELTTAQDHWCLADPGNVYAIYLPSGGVPELDLGDSTATFQIQWFNPRTGGSLRIGTIALVTGPGKTSIGQPPEDTDKDWVALVERVKPRHIVPTTDSTDAPASSEH